MAKAGKIRPKQIKKAQRLISSLPVKDEGCSREEAAALLEKDLKRAFKKGYSPKEICALFKKEGIIIARHVIEKYQDEDEDSQLKTSSPEKITPNDIGTPLKGSDGTVSNSFVPSHPETQMPQSSVQKSMDEQKIPGQVHSDETYLKPGTFPIMPDTPIGEL